MIQYNHLDEDTIGLLHTQSSSSAGLISPYLKFLAYSLVYRLVTKYQRMSVRWFSGFGSRSYLVLRSIRDDVCYVLFTTVEFLGGYTSRVSVHDYVKCYR